MLSKKASATGAAALQPLDPNQDALSLREARNQKRKATSPTPQEDDLDQEIQNLEMLHQQVQRKKEKMARLADLQRQIDEASEEVRHLAQDEQNRRPSHRELHQEGFYNCWGPSVSEGPQKHDLTICEQVSSESGHEYTRTWSGRSLSETKGDYDEG
jgi:hypothetical protein